MATALWAKVYYQDIYAGLLKQEPDGRCVFSYDLGYLSNPLSLRIAFAFPLREEPFICESGLHPFFDNLVAEGWFQNAQARALAVSLHNRFALLLGFGYDLAGAVSIVDPEPRAHISLSHSDEVTIAAVQSRASLSGIQRKLLVVKEGELYRPVKKNELSTHIAKLTSGTLRDVIELEYLSTQVMRVLLPEDAVVEMEISHISSIQERALVIKRFDRTESGKRIHFEEFNQLLGHASGDSKYAGSYEDMGRFIRATPECLAVEAHTLCKRILACFLIGNTDAHLKNFAMFHARDGWRLTPAYDLVAAARYKEYRTIALSVGGVRDLDLGALKAKHLVAMASDFGLNTNSIQRMVNDFSEKLPIALSTIAECAVGMPLLGKKLTALLEKRWNSSFALIGQLLSKRQSKGANHLD